MNKQVIFEGTRYDSNGYPTEELLEYIRKYDVLQGYEFLLDVIKEEFEQYGWYSFRDGILRLATGGWSGCEELIDALRENMMFTAMTWLKSERGGLHLFEIAKTSIESQIPYPENKPEKDGRYTVTARFKSTGTRQIECVRWVEQAKQWDFNGQGYWEIIAFDPIPPIPFGGF